jgi:hypothetical protein
MKTLLLLPIMLGCATSLSNTEVCESKRESLLQDANRYQEKHNIQMQTIERDCDAHMNQKVGVCSEANLDWAQCIANRYPESDPDEVMAEYHRVRPSFPNNLSEQESLAILEQIAATNHTSHCVDMLNKVGNESKALLDRFAAFKAECPNP